MAFAINESLCKGCGACFENCPAGAVSKKGACYAIEASKCAMCGTCADNCPSGAACEC